MFKLILSDSLILQVNYLLEYLRLMINDDFTIIYCQMLQRILLKIEHYLSMQGRDSINNSNRASYHSWQTNYDDAIDDEKD